MAMFNHSCDPNIVRIDKAKWVIAAACTDINKGQVKFVFNIHDSTYSNFFKFFPISGDEVRDSYGSTFSEEEQDERRDKLWKNFWFKCMCKACRKRWPTREDLPCNMFEVKKLFVVLFASNQHEQVKFLYY